MVNLDDKNAILKLQGGDTVLKSVDALPQQLKQSFNESLKVKFPAEYRKVKNVVVCGMGGSQWPARIAHSLYKEEIKIPYVVNSDYSLPGFVDQNSLVILSSYSGTTEESLICGEKAHRLGAKLTGITSGGDVELFLKQLNAPVYIFNPVHNPSKQPRIGFGYGVGAHLGLLLNLGLLNFDKENVQKSFEEMSTLLRNFMIGVLTKDNPAKKLAQKLFQKYPYYLVGEFLIGLGNAVQNQTNETAKSISSFRVIPELNHHLMEGLRFPNVLKDLLVFVFFYSHFYSDRIKKRFEITKDVVEQNKIKTIWIELKGESKLDQALYLMGMGSYMSMYLSALYEQNPSVIPYVDYFKKKLKEMA